MKASILFVDDNENVLQGLKRNLRSVRKEWQTQFANCGDNALDVLNDNEIDVIVTDIRMPGMDGSELLKKALDAHGNTIRIVLSGQCEEEVILRLLSVSHQYMAKPFDVDLIIETVKATLKLRDLLDAEELKSFITQIRTLPSLPALQEQITSELAAETGSNTALENLISKDVSLFAKLFQIMNSSYFGTSQNITNMAYAWELLGREKVTDLIEGNHIMAPLNKNYAEDPFIQKIWQYSAEAAELSKKIAEHENLSAKDTSTAYALGLLHVIGAIVLYEFNQQNPDLAPETADALIENPDETDNYIQAGGFLIGLWGLPESLTNAILYQADPDQSTVESNKQLIEICHAVRAILMPKYFSKLTGEQLLSSNYCQTSGLNEKLNQWKEL